MPKPKALVTRAIPQEALELVAAHADMEVWPHDEPPDAFTLHRMVGNIDGILTNIMDRIDADFFDAAPKLKVVSQMAVGLDNVDVRKPPVAAFPSAIRRASCPTPPPTRPSRCCWPRPVG